MRNYKAGKDRAQSTLLPSRLEDYVDENNPVRAIDIYVDSLDVEKLGFGNTKMSSHHSGQPAYPPRALLKLYIYGYLNRIRSSRDLEKECHRNLEVIWLVEDRKPSYKTISDFRKDNAKAIRNTHIDFILLCKKLSLFGGKRVAVDGSFFNGNVSKKSFVTTKKLDRDIAKLDEKISNWLSEMDVTDADEAPYSTTTEEGLSDKLETLKLMQAKKAEKEAQKKVLEEAGKTQQSMVDPDAKLLNKRGNSCAGYNVQIVTDAKHKLILGDDVVPDNNDLSQLHPMAKRAKDTLGVDSLEVLGDAGYYSGSQVAGCLSDDITPYVPDPKKSGNTPSSKRLSRDQFIYDEQKDCYYCPYGQPLLPKGQPRKQASGWIQCYRSVKKTCKRCDQRTNCLSSKSQNREIWRNEHEKILVEHNVRMKENARIMRERCALVEHPFGTLKCRAGWTHFLVRGLTKVKGEWSLMALAYNFTRCLNILGIETFKRQVAA